MGVIKYTLKIDGVVAAEHMELETACVLLEALFNKYFQQAGQEGLEVSIASEPYGESGNCCVSEG